EGRAPGLPSGGSPTHPAPDRDPSRGTPARTASPRAADRPPGPRPGTPAGGASTTLREAPPPGARQPPSGRRFEALGLGDRGLGPPPAAGGVTAAGLGAAAPARAAWECPHAVGQGDSRLGTLSPGHCLPSVGQGCCTGQEAYALFG